MSSMYSCLPSFFYHLLAGGPCEAHVTARFLALSPNLNCGLTAEDGEDVKTAAVRH